MLRKKFYGVPEHHRKKQKASDEEREDDVDDDENNEEPEEDGIPEGDVVDEDEDDENPAAYQSGSFNKFGTGPAGSPNGVGYEDAKVNQAGCSGSHIHICSGTTVYLTNPDENTNQNPLLENPEFKAVEPEKDDDDTEETPKPKYGRKRVHAHHQ